MTQAIEKRLRFYGQIIFGCAFLFIVPVFAAVSSTRSAPQLGPTPLPVTARQAQAKERRNPLRRFFSWVTETVSRPFRKRVPVIRDPPVVFITSSTSLIEYCPAGTQSVDNCSASREVELSAGVNGPDAKLLYVWSVSAGQIRGEGKTVIWDLSDAADGTYIAEVEVTTPMGHIVATSTKVTIALCRNCIKRESGAAKLDEFNLPSNAP